MFWDGSTLHHGKSGRVHDKEFCLERQRDKLAAELDRIKRACAEQELDIQQTCGKALGYPWYKDDPKNFPGATEKDGVFVGEHVAASIVSELARKYTALLERGHDR